MTFTDVVPRCWHQNSFLSAKNKYSGRKAERISFIYIWRLINCSFAYSGHAHFVLPVATEARVAGRQQISTENEQGVNGLKLFTSAHVQTNAARRRLLQTFKRHWTTEAGLKWTVCPHENIRNTIKLRVCVCLNHLPGKVLPLMGTDGHATNNTETHSCLLHCRTQHIYCYYIQITLTEYCLHF